MLQLSNNRRKLYASLATAKGRKEHGMFMAQGEKCVCDTIDHFKLVTIIATQKWIDAHQDMLSIHTITVAKPDDMRKTSTLSTPPEVIAIYEIPELHRPSLKGQLVVALDCIQDPGNLGTILRVADWMGVRTVLASYDTVDVWNPKVIQATMGAISRVNVHYCDLDDVLSRAKDINIYGTFLEGESIYTSQLSADGVIVMGNEGKGISSKLENLITHKITIPPYPSASQTSESLNVAIATAITLAEFRRRIS